MGGGGIPGMSDDGKDDEKENRKNQNRSLEATLENLISEFNEFLENFDEDADPPSFFIDVVLKEYEEEYPTSYNTYKEHIFSLFDVYFENKLREILEKRVLPFPLKMEDLRQHIFKFLHFPTEDQQKNSHFLSQQIFEDFITKTIEKHQMATVKWEQDWILLNEMSSSFYYIKHYYIIYIFLGSF